MGKLRDKSEKLIEKINNKVGECDGNDFGFMKNYKALRIAKDMYIDAVRKNGNLDHIKDAIVHYELEEDAIIKKIMDSDDIVFEDIKNRIKNED